MEQVLIGIQAMIAMLFMLLKLMIGSSLKPCMKVIVYQTTSKKWAIPLHNF